MPGTYRCQCYPGFRGSFCSEDIDECETDPCKNGGRCENNFGTFECLCRIEYYGLLCEKACRFVKMEYKCFFIIIFKTKYVSK